MPVSKGYDADELIKWIQQTEALVVILPRSNRTVLRDYDKALYKEFNLVEWMSGYLQALPSEDNTVRQDLAPSRRLSSSRF
ncbi:MAG: hypothetical protein E8D49_01430 [Nitrospira sp.]|nr:MAG: hypothetical protein E8D49_01430 [Nitrospira sp.]